MRTLLLIVSLGLSAPIWADEVRLQDNAPDRHVVVKGDTLWGISEKFLKDPWLWPEVWQLNRDEIKNPHLIYPGDVVILTMEGGRPRLSFGSGRFGETVKLSPSIRGEPIVTREQGIPVIPLHVIKPFMSHASIVDPAAMEAAPRLLGAADERVLMMRSDVVYATQGDVQTADWHIVRLGKELLDPDTKESLGFEGIHVGEAHTVIPGNPQTLTVTQSYMEIARGDKLLPAMPFSLEGVAPHAPSQPVDGKIISAYGGLAASGQYATVVLNKGRRDGVENGHVLAIYHQGRSVKNGTDVSSAFRYMDTKCLKREKNIAFDGFHDPKEEFEDCKEDATTPMLQIKEAWRYMDVGCLKPGAKINAFEFFDPKEVYRLHCRPGQDDMIKLPDARVGLVLVYKTYEKAAYAVVMRSTGPVYLMDAVRNP